MRRGARPIPVDKQALADFVQQRLVPRVVEILRGLPGDEPLNDGRSLGAAQLRLRGVSGIVRVYSVIVSTRMSKHKGAAVLAGALQGDRIHLMVNGALTPNDILKPTAWSDRLSPLDQCTHETCLPYGLYSILLHEATHAADSFRSAPTYDSQKVKDWAPEEQESYVNDPGEVAAWIQQVVDETVQLAKKLRPLVRSDQDLINKSLQVGTTWRVVGALLSDANRRKILKAVHQALDEANLLGIERNPKAAGSLNGMKVKVSAASHEVERLSEPLQQLYPELRNHFLRAHIEVKAEDNALIVTFQDGATARVTETPGHRYRVRCSRSVPGKRGKSQLVEQSKTCQTTRDVLYGIDKVFDLHGAKIALKLNITGPTSEIGVYAGRIAFDFMKFLGDRARQFDSFQLGEQLAQFIHTSKWSRGDAQTFRDMMRIAEQRYGLHIETDDLERALRNVGKR